MRDHEAAWVQYECFILLDGWKDRREMAFINFLVNRLKGSMFVESADASTYSKTSEKYI